MSEIRPKNERIRNAVERRSLQTTWITCRGGITLISRSFPALAGMRFLLSLVYLGVTIYFFALLSRATIALEKIASALISRPPEDKR